MDYDTIRKNHKIDTTRTEKNICFNVYCIHQKEAFCQLSRIFLDDRGVCSQCQMLKPDQDETILQYRKDQARKR